MCTQVEVHILIAIVCMDELCFFADDCAFLSNAVVNTSIIFSEGVIMMEAIGLGVQLAQLQKQSLTENANAVD